MEETEEQQCAQVTACAFIGHRPTRFSFKYDEEHPDCLKPKAVLSEQTGLLYQQGVTDFYTGCALCVDMWVCEAVLSLMELHPEVKLVACPLCQIGKEIDGRAAGAVSCYVAPEQRNRYCAGEIRQ